MRIVETYMRTDDMGEREMKGEGDGMTREDESSLALAAPSVCLTFVYPGENGGWLRNSVQLSSVQFNFICVTPHYYKVVPGHFTR